MTDKTIDAIMRQAERFRLAELIPGGEYRAAHGALQSAITAALAQARWEGIQSVHKQTSIIVRAALELLEGVEGEAPFDAGKVAAFKRVFSTSEPEGVAFEGIADTDAMRALRVQMYQAGVKCTDGRALAFCAQAIQQARADALEEAAQYADKFPSYKAAALIRALKGAA